MKTCICMKDDRQIVFTKKSHRKKNKQEKDNYKKKEIT